MQSVSPSRTEAREREQADALHDVRSSPPDHRRDRRPRRARHRRRRRHHRLDPPAPPSSCASLEKAYANRNINHGHHRPPRAHRLVRHQRRPPRRTEPPPSRTSRRCEPRRCGTRPARSPSAGGASPDGLASHVDPSQAGMTPSAAIAQRIANAGYCTAGTPNTNENTFSAGATASSPRRSRAPSIGGSRTRRTARPCSAPPTARSASAPAPPAPSRQDTGGAQAITVVADFGTCAT